MTNYNLYGLFIQVFFLSICFDIKLLFFIVFIQILIFLIVCFALTLYLGIFLSSPYGDQLVDFL